VEGHFIGDIGLVEGRAVKLGKLRLLVRRLLGEGAAGVVVGGRDVQLLDQIERLLVHRLMIAHHAFGKGANFLVLGFCKRLLPSFDVNDAGSIGNVRDLRIGRLGRGLGKGK